MACPVVHTGQNFLANALAHIDCQAGAIGSYGYGALASPGSPISTALTSLLTIFIALFGMRLLLGHPMARRDVVGDLLKIGIMLTLATSWPAWRIVGYDLVIHGPGQFAQLIGTSAGLPGSAGDLPARLQNVDKGLAALNSVGSGRLGVAQGDWFQLGFARSAYLVGTLGPLALVRLSAGFLLAIAPMMAGLLLFGITRGIFEGWVRALVATFLGSMLLSIIYGVELAMIEPWLQDALQLRAAEQTTLDAPVEILVAALSFAVVSLAGVFFIARLAFHANLNVTTFLADTEKQSGRPNIRQATINGANDEAPSRAVAVAQSVSDNLRRQERIANISRTDSRGGDRANGDAAPSTLATQTGQAAGENALGNTWRRPSRRQSGAARRRDQN